jgi:hypothetical protein
MIHRPGLAPGLVGAGLVDAGLVDAGGSRDGGAGHRLPRGRRLTARADGAAGCRREAFSLPALRVITMAYITPSSDGQARAIMFVGALLSLPSGVGLMVGGPLSAFTALGAAFIAVGVWFAWRWWLLLSESPGRSRRLLLIGASLNVVSTVLLGLSGWLYFNTTQPGDGLSAFAWTIAVGSAGIACLIGRIVVGVQRQLLHRRRGS